MIAVKTWLIPIGLRQAAGLHARKNFIAEEDADVVHLMREAGAIPLCVTNVSELCMWWESSNTIYGRTNNPYRTCRIVGGSSGGEASVKWFYSIFSFVFVGGKRSLRFMEKLVVSWNILCFTVYLEEKSNFKIWSR